MTSMTLTTASLALLRNDLRIHDNEVLFNAFNSKADFVIPYYCLDPRQVDVSYLTGNKPFPLEPKTFVGEFPKCGPFRSRFLVQTLNELKHRLHEKGSGLLIVQGKPEEVTQSLLGWLHDKRIDVKSFYCQKEISSEELEVERNLRTVLEKINVKPTFMWGLTLNHLNDLPFDPYKTCPNTFTEYRKLVESKVSVRPLVETIFGAKYPFEELKDFTHALCGELELPLNSETDPRAFKIEGGETEALARLDYYLFKSRLIDKYKDSRNGLIGKDYSTKFSPYLANGSLSPRLIFHELNRYEELYGNNDGTYWCFFELLWRDYFKWVGMCYGDELFSIRGLKDVEYEWKRDPKLEFAFFCGKTGVTFIDAGMRELNKSGFSSNRMRQNIASFWSKSLGLDWRICAAYFESMLIDYDVHSNYGNWLYASGIGNDPRQDRKFNVVKQARDYDPNGEYCKLWVEELRNVEGDVIYPSSKHYIKPMIYEREWERHKNKKTDDVRKSDWKIKRFNKK